MSTTVEQIKDKLDITEVLGSYMKLERAGINLKARCPFHNEKTASFFVSPSRQSFYCFGCQAKGDIFSFVEKFEGLDFKGALKILADRAGIPLTNFRDTENKDETDRLFKVLEVATDIFEQTLKDNSKVIEYLEKRGLREETARKWRLGFAIDEWHLLEEKLLQKGFTKEEMLAVGLSKTTPDKKKVYDTFRSRVIFPICDPAGRIVGFSGRIFESEAANAPKYLNSPETTLFKKSEILYGLHLAKNHIRSLDYAVLVEGQMDLLLSHQAGVGNTVASSGTALSIDHLKRLKKLSNRVIISYDSDEAGAKASLRGAELALDLGMEVKIASLPEGEDPASVAGSDSEKWKEALRTAIPVIDFVLQKATEENSGPKVSKAVVANVLPLVSLIKSEIEKSEWVKKVAKTLGVSSEAVWSDLSKVQSSHPNQKEGEREQKEVRSREHLTETNLLRLYAGIIFREEAEGAATASGKNILRKELSQILGDERAIEILESYENEKESLIFEAEQSAEVGNIEKVGEELLKRIEVTKLREELHKKTLLLDQKNSLQDEDVIKSEIESVSKRIQELSK